MIAGFIVDFYCHKSALVVEVDGDIHDLQQDEDARQEKALTIKVNWDHQLPYAFSQNNATSNFVAACHVCNGIKSDRLFKTVEEAQLYLAQKRKQKGYDF